MAPPAPAASPARRPPEAGSETEEDTVDSDVMEQLQAYLPPGVCLPRSIRDFPLPDPSQPFSDTSLKKAVRQARARGAALASRIEREEELAAQLVRTRDGIVTQHGVNLWTKTAARECPDWEYARNVWRDVSAVDREYRMAAPELELNRDTARQGADLCQQTPLAAATGDGPEFAPETWTEAMEKARAAKLGLSHDRVLAIARGILGVAAPPGPQTVAAAGSAQGAAHERRPDPTAPESGDTFTMGQFIDFHGPERGVEMWEEGGRLLRLAGAAWESEMRFDPNRPNSPRVYTRKQFIDLYGPKGGPLMWRKAETAPPRPAATVRVTTKVPNQLRSNAKPWAPGGAPKDSKLSRDAKPWTPPNPEAGPQQESSSQDTEQDS
eukprot:TRINITY_DN17972_c0_g3_i2.p1 TRINITY_DN17972_c0_g3~~TRINITY_DN17972_c0_g3_i2.p1  ORF type:complete len:413 (+),score=123.25 TRINITY_DN17972_c0_g3_i2:98-1240(+)